MKELRMGFEKMVMYAENGEQCRHVLLVFINSICKLIENENRPSTLMNEWMSHAKRIAMFAEHRRQ